MPPPLHLTEVGSLPKPGPHRPACCLPPTPSSAVAGSSPVPSAPTCRPKHLHFTHTLPSGVASLHHRGCVQPLGLWEGHFLKRPEIQGKRRGYNDDGSILESRGRCGAPPFPQECELMLCKIQQSGIMQALGPEGPESVLLFLPCVSSSR